jgi:hypothetical protein
LGRTRLLQFLALDEQASLEDPVKRGKLIVFMAEIREGYGSTYQSAVSTQKYAELSLLAES